MDYDFNRPYLDLDQMRLYEAIDRVTRESYGAFVRAAELSNSEYNARYERLGRANNMKSPPDRGRIFSGYLVVRKLGTHAQYETWMPDYVFEELYRLATEVEARATS